MKKNFSVNIGGRIFNIDDDAYESLNAYMSRLKKFFAGEQDINEIISDIEMRIADLLDQQNRQGQPITVSEISKVIKSMGEPDQMAGEESAAHTIPNASRTRGKLFRDRDNRQIAGVAAGIAAWFGMDTVWVRLIFVALVFFYGIGILIYAVLWLIVPAAQTTSEKLEMQRQIININTLRNELNSAGKGIRSTGNEVAHGIGTFMRFITEIVGHLLRLAYKIFGRLTGLVLLAGVVMLFVGISLASLVRSPMNMGDYQLDSTTFLHALQWFIPGPDVRWLAYFAVILVVTALTGLLIYAGLRLLLKWPPLKWQVVLAFVGLLVVGLIMGVAAVFQYSRSTEDVASITNRYSLRTKSSKLHIASGPHDFHTYFLPLSGDTIQGNRYYALGEAELSIRPVPADSVFVTCVKRASGWHDEQAAVYASAIIHHFDLADTLLTINPWFMIPMADGMRYQKLDVIVGVPVNTQVQIDEHLLWRIDGSDFVDYEREEGVYLMTASGLKHVKNQIMESDSTMLK